MTDHGSLHAHEITPDDAALLRMMAGATFGPDATIRLPSGKTITGAEMARWLTSKPEGNPMTTPQLTVEQRLQLERIATRVTWTTRVSGVLVFVLLLAAIWLGDGRFAATAALVLPVGVVAAALAGRLRRALARTEEGP